MRKADALLLLAVETLDADLAPYDRLAAYDALEAVGQAVIAATTRDKDQFALAETITLIAKDGAKAIRDVETAQLKFDELFAQRRISPPSQQ